MVERTSYCRICVNYCPIVATVTDGRVVEVRGDRANPIWKGYTCIKGRKQHLRVNSDSRLKKSLRRSKNGEFEPIESWRVMDEIADRLGSIIARHGSKAIAYYVGTAMQGNVLMNAMSKAFMDAIGSDLIYTPATIDKPGKPLAKALHGNWMAPHQGYHDPDIAVLVGANPLVSYSGAPIGNPGWLQDRVREGMQLVVIDPRRTETATRATQHIQPRPSSDPAILAAFVHVILAEDLIDHAFVEQNASGLEKLREAVRPFSPEAVASFAGTTADELRRGARSLGEAARGYIFCGTGVSMGNPGPLSEYLALCLQTLRGHWMRAGEVVRNAPVLLPMPRYVAQAAPPRSARLGRPMLARDLEMTVAGPPTAALPDEILSEDEGQVRALISCGGNPVGAWPDQDKVVSALGKLELLVQIDPVMSQTAKIADYVVAPLMPFETPDISQWQDYLGLHGTGTGNTVAHAQYTPAIASPPHGSDLLGEWEFFYGLAQRLWLRLEVTETCFGYRDIEPFVMDMQAKPTWDALLERLAAGSRVPLDEVKRHAHGMVFQDPPAVVAAAAPDWPHRLNLGNDEMVAALAELAARLPQERGADGFTLVSRRSRELLNTWLNDGTTTGGIKHNPLFMHPDDMRQIDCAEGDQVNIGSRHATIPGIVVPDATLRRGVVSMTHGYGDLDDHSRDARGAYREHGSSVTRLMENDDECDSYSGMPKLSGISVSITKR